MTTLVLHQMRQTAFDRADLVTVAQTPEGKQAMAIAVEDEARVIDFANSALWIAKERVFIDRR